MDSFKEFQGKSLDEAISEACGYFDAPREKLEIEILQDSKSGIFGLVGARKAMVRARRVQLRAAVEDILGRKPAEHAEKRDKRDKHEKCEKMEGACGEATAEKAARPDKACSEKTDRGQDKLGDKHDDKPGEQAAAVAPHGLAARESGEACAVEKHDKGERPAKTDDKGKTASPERGDRPERAERRDRSERQERPERSDRPERQDRRAKPAPKPGARRGERQNDRQGERVGERLGEGRPRSAAPSRPRQDESAFHGDAFGEEVLHEDGDNLQRIPFEELDQDKLRTLSLEVVATLVAPIVGELPLSVELQDGRVNVRMDCGDDSGLLIGREGQTLASLQYLASRMVSRGMSAAVRVQLDAGEYRLRQDEKLREMALSLAEKVRATGKSHSTRPLSSYHRRIVHLVLQDSSDVQTRSSGDGPLKRVVVQRKRS